MTVNKINILEINQTSATSKNKSHSALTADLFASTYARALNQLDMPGKDQANIKDKGGQDSLTANTHQSLAAKKRQDHYESTSAEKEPKKIKAANDTDELAPDRIAGWQIISTTADKQELNVDEYMKMKTTEFSQEELTSLEDINEGELNQEELQALLAGQEEQASGLIADENNSSLFGQVLVENLEQDDHPPVSAKASDNTLSGEKQETDKINLKATSKSDIRAHASKENPTGTELDQLARQTDPPAPGLIAQKADLNLKETDELTATTSEGQKEKNKIKTQIDTQPQQDTTLGRPENTDSAEYIDPTEQLLTQEIQVEAGQQFSRELVDKVDFHTLAQTQQLTVSLRPDSFGKLTIRLIKGEEGLIAQLISDTPATRELLSQQQGDLQEALKEQGYDLVQTEILSDFTDHQQSNESFNAWQERMPQERNSNSLLASANTINISEINENTNYDETSMSQRHAPTLNKDGSVDYFA